MNYHVEGTFSWDADGFPAIRLENGTMPLADGKEIRVSNGEDWISGIHIYGDLLRGDRIEMLQPGARIRILNK
ncbi:hypothetical protein [Aneurinibacillus aneurinilyticus]|jgi:hypothetical protein|uniref:DUF5348 domain-containing protein n=2 Tax=Aneurinibacillus aneurinilyticus TaxID=1391 RepID=A0A848CSW5_ANEAE|nr:hypothetical protein [Aneurinibacillus aneurinilyticus]ERI09304.1 hypothetical protein HMPREF0083_02583 [Aneurinibacillus aneurinilyticus ATCC 12856]MCI1694598.1 hypothetical protein [Aneurinibacillus aneurinilyticus]MED0704671.1 hypothetical protein [Aneurinibacillus aneurinilyticus]MED0724011.1 hypothetical protein [Aneurinibacillus aneurinilyticus]MED0732020.1 hypothetical protein [Aneurinibacillus aneurinilyticus]